MNSGALGGTVAVFFVVQICIIAFAANGPFVDEGLYTVAGIRVLEGHGLADGYFTWFNGSPFVWPVIAAVGHHFGGLTGARSMAAILSTITLFALATTTEHLFGSSAAVWSSVAFGVNGLFLALAHFAVYDVAALTALALSAMCVTRPSTRDLSPWAIAGAVAFAAAVITKYGYVLMLIPVLGLLVSVRGIKRSGCALTVFLAVAGAILVPYFWLSFGSLYPGSSAAYLGQTFGRSRSHIAVLQIVIGVAPCVLAGAGGFLAWRRGERLLVLTCLLALTIYPVFHLWTANFVSGQKHVVAGFVFAYLLAGLTFERLWTSRSRTLSVILLATLTIWGGVQCFVQDRSWSDTRALTHYLVTHMKHGERIVAESSWSHSLYLYPQGLIAAPTDVIDANHPARGELPADCRIAWLVGNQESAPFIRDAVKRCAVEPVLSSTTRHYYLDTMRLRFAAYPVVVGLYRVLPP